MLQIWLDPERVAAGISALAGAIVYGTYNLVTLYTRGQSPTMAELYKAAINAVSALLVGVLVAFLAGPAIAKSIPLEPLKSPWLVGILLGAFLWELLPVAYQAAKKRLGGLGGS